MSDDRLIIHPCIPDLMRIKRVSNVDLAEASGYCLETIQNIRLMRPRKAYIVLAVWEALRTRTFTPTKISPRTKSYCNSTDLCPYRVIRYPYRAPRCMAPLGGCDHQSKEILQ